MDLLFIYIIGCATTLFTLGAMGHIMHRAGWVVGRCVKVIDAEQQLVVVELPLWQGDVLP